MLHRLLRRPHIEITEQRSPFPSMSWAAYQNLLAINGVQYRTDPFRASGARALLADCGPAYAVLDRRASILGEARPMFQRFESGKPAGLFSNRDLGILESPWEGGSWRLLTAIMEADVASSGNSYWIRQGRELMRLEPDWVTIVTEEVTHRDATGKSGQVGERLIGYAVARPGSEAVVLEPYEIAHYRPSPSAQSSFRGESWLAAVASDASSDVEMTRYKGGYLKNGALPSLAVLYEPTIDPEQLRDFVGAFAEKFSGSMNAGKVMHFLGGRDVKTVGATLNELAFKAVQGAGETRIASAAGVPAVVAGFSEGMQGSSLNAGNYQATRRLFADAKIRPLLGSAVEALAHLVPAPGGCRLWYDDSQVSFFQEDVADEATIRQLYAQTIRTLIEAGYEPDAAVLAVTSGNYAGLLGKHSGLMSVQLQPPADDTEDPTDAADPADAEDDTPDQGADT